MHQRGHINNSPALPKVSLVLIHTAEGRPLIHIGMFYADAEDEHSEHARAPYMHQPRDVSWGGL
jgi:hypothetical protein